MPISTGPAHSCPNIPFADQNLPQVQRRDSVSAYQVPAPPPRWEGVDLSDALTAAFQWIGNKELQRTNRSDPMFRSDDRDFLAGAIAIEIADRKTKVIGRRTTFRDSN